MTITKKLTKRGNSYALVIEKAILELLRIDEQTLFQISIPDGVSIVVTPVKSREENQGFDDSVQRVNRKYRHTLNRLSN